MPKKITLLNQKQLKFQNGICNCLDYVEKRIFKIIRKLLWDFGGYRVFQLKENYNLLKTCLSEIKRLLYSIEPDRKEYIL